MDRKTFMKELEYLLQDVQKSEREDALSFYENYFDEAGIENESAVLEELGDPSRVAAMIKDGLQGAFDDNIGAGNSGFTHDRYNRIYEVADANGEKNAKENGFSHFRNRWEELERRDKRLIIVLIMIACLPVVTILLTFLTAIFGVATPIIAIVLTLIFGFVIISFILGAAGVVSIVIGVMQLLSIPSEGLIWIGIGFILIAFADIFGKITSQFYKLTFGQFSKIWQSLSQEKSTTGGTAK